MSVLVDTSGILAQLDADDPHHRRAAAWLERARGAGEDLVIHSYVASEASALVQRRLGAEALRALHLRLAPIFVFVPVDRETHDAAVAALLAALPTTVSLVDHVSFQLMRERGIRRAFAFDPDFATAGLETVP